MNDVQDGSRQSARRPAVTIAIPTYNRAAWIEGAVLASLAQTYPDFEVLVSDNASTDDTLTVLAQFKDPRFRVVRQERNLGLVGNWNACVAEARGTYLALVPDDDRIAPEFLERCMALIKREPNLPIVLGLSDLQLSGEAAPVLRAFPNRRFATGIWDGTALLREFLEDRIATQMCSLVIGTDALRSRGGFPNGLPFSLDKAGWAPLLLQGRAGFVNESCGTFNWHETNHTHSLDVKRCLDDEWDFAAMLIGMAKERITDPERRAGVVRGAKRYFGRRALEIIAACRKDGASFHKILPLLWHHRSSLVHARVDNPMRLARLVSVLMLPSVMTEQIRRLKRHYARDLSWKP